MLAAERRSKGRLLYAENWVYAPAVQKEREILEKTGGQILWMHGEEAHSGSHSVDYAYAARCGGGVLIGKGCHPLTAALYLKRVEGRTRHGAPIRPKTVSARTHAITRLPGFRDEGHIRRDYYDIDDFSIMHVEFDDGTVADVIASDIVMGGIHNSIEVAPTTTAAVQHQSEHGLQTYNPVEKNFADVYVVEKIGTKQGWACTSPEEDWFTGYPQEIEAFYRTIAYGEPPESDSLLAADAISTIYSAYVSAQKQGTAAVRSRSLSLWERVRVRAGRRQETLGIARSGVTGPHPRPLSQREREDTTSSAKRPCEGCRRCLCGPSAPPPARNRNAQGNARTADRRRGPAGSSRSTPPARDRFHNGRRPTDSKARASRGRCTSDSPTRHTSIPAGRAKTPCRSARPSAGNDPAATRRRETSREPRRAS